MTDPSIVAGDLESDRGEHDEEDGGQHEQRVEREARDDRRLAETRRVQQREQHVERDAADGACRVFGLRSGPPRNATIAMDECTKPASPSPTEHTSTIATHDSQPETRSQSIICR